MPSEQQTERRRTTRVPHSVGVILSGMDIDGNDFTEETETMAVSKQGVSVRTRHTLVLGQEVSIRLKEKKRVGQFELVWGGMPGTPHEGIIGLEWLEARRFWGLQFPPEDWGAD